MIKIRLWAALWALTTLALSLLLFGSPVVKIGLPIALALSSLCLVAIVPFNARKRGARIRVALGCALYSLGTLIALGVAIVERAPLPLAALVLLFALFGFFLTGWAWFTRNRQRRAGYFDNED
ncbi:hypothetical protein ASG67_10375 [Sphingomonas sp. Leaf339]|uniref:hypothetical protein n=1 Tax=Sphingomonas sp. Leaf339 TaxID=1736343 RepID=UPI000701E544|nr:hypothetical protein [Sphingomonas sp. Leaf339]KQU53208.1 hypothetical protein ASG67_10375 [Sphingomonas sp. Leaf339]